MNMLKIGMELILETDQVETEKYKSKIEDFDVNKIHISYPIGMETNKTVFLRTDMELFASFVDADSGAYLFRTKIIGRIKNHVPLLILSFPGPDHLLKVQRRQFVRIETAVDIALDFPEVDKKFSTVTDDFSAGGCAAIIPNHIDIKNGEIGTIYIVLPMQNGEYIYLNSTCRIIRTFEKGKIHLASIQFLNIGSQEQQQLIRFCFEKQLEYRKRGIPIE